MPGQEVGCRLPGLSIGWDINRPKVSHSWMQGLTARGGDREEGPAQSGQHGCGPGLFPSEGVLGLPPRV